MIDRDCNFVISALSGDFTADGVSVEVNIIRFQDDGEWTLEVVSSCGSSIVWEGPFESEEQAHAAFLRIVTEEGMKAFIEAAKPSNVIPFRRPH